MDTLSLIVNVLGNMIKHVNYGIYREKRLVEKKITQPFFCKYKSEISIQINNLMICPQNNAY